MKKPDEDVQDIFALGPIIAIMLEPQEEDTYLIFCSERGRVGLVYNRAQTVMDFSPDYRRLAQLKPQYKQSVIQWVEYQERQKNDEQYQEYLRLKGIYEDNTELKS